MIITNPKHRKIINSTIVNAVFYLFTPLFLLASIEGTVEGFIIRKYRELKKRWF